MTRFIPRGRPAKYENRTPISMALESELLKRIDQYIADHGISSLTELVRQLFHHVLNEDQEDKNKQLAQQGKDISISILSHELDKSTNNETTNDIINNGRKLTVIGNTMEKISSLLNQINSELETIPDRQLINKLKMSLKPFKQTINDQSMIEYKQASGLTKTLQNAQEKRKVSKEQFWESKIDSMNTTNINTTTTSTSDGEEVIL